jgi:hypothetical protein
MQKRRAQIVKQSTLGIAGLLKGAGVTGLHSDPGPSSSGIGPLIFLALASQPCRIHITRLDRISRNVNIRILFEQTCHSPPLGDSRCQDRCPSPRLTTPSGAGIVGPIFCQESCRRGVARWPDPRAHAPT